MRRLILGLSLVAVAAAGLAAPPETASAQAVRDPYLVWRTIRTPRFRLHYHEPLGVLARHTAAVLERADRVLSRLLGNRPRGPIHVVLSDDYDGANGLASTLPYNTIRLFATAPEDIAGLGDYEDWMTELVTHEHTHIVHLDTVSGIPAIINAVFGRVYSPNNVQPRWVIEGLATHEESAQTAGGRVRSSMFRMFLRMDALEGRLLRLDELSNITERFPAGNGAYLYGSRFLGYIAERFGDEALRDMSHGYGRQLIPYGLNRIARRATGHTFVELYEDWRDELRRESLAVQARVEAEGRVEGRRLTHRGYDALAPRFVGEDEVLYYRSDGHEEPSLHFIDARTGAEHRMLARTRGNAYHALHPNGRDVYYHQSSSVRDIYFMNDLWRIDRDGGRSTRVTHGLRASEPDVSPDGRRIVFTVNSAATRHLAVADPDDVDGTMEILYRSRRYEQIYTPRYSPDGRRIAFSSWREGGFRDVQILDVATGEVEEVTRDRAFDTGPAWAPDGRLLYFSSDRTGIANIYAYELGTRRLRQVTNVVGGAFHPAISPSGRRLVYLGFTSYGFDLYGMALDPARFREAADYVDDRPAARPPETMTVASEPYRPGPTLLPRAWLLELDEDGFGRALAITWTGGDVVGYHGYDGRIGIGLQRGDVGVSLGYSYQRLPTPISLRLFRLVRPAGGLSVGGQQRTWIEDVLGASVGISYTIHGRLHRENIGLSYELNYGRKAEPFGGRLDPNTPPPVLPDPGLRAFARLAWSFSNVVQTTYDVSPSRGQALSLAVSFSDPAIGSINRQVDLTWSFTQYLENPWVEHHVLAMRYAGGISGGSRQRSAFSVGGFPEQDLLNAVIDNLHFGGVALRGYRPFSRAGEQFHLLQVEYRFPIWRAERGLGTLPIFLRRLFGGLFVDYGDAFFGQIDLGEFRLGLGAELHTQLLLGYYLYVQLRAGFAYGVHEGGGARFYFHLGLPF